ncbi:calphotin-like protein [Trypanosoma grayi]|uniref:calphotin-like protein n=1 Tax=Trypanosoma grayi TaxID=71804 RepID=UPI0004F49D69|nr:calphotin-like protein [Trypanosoma grayi]KEG13164.1 calphotin-like protein [Trypanosoma grayi]
MQRGSDQVPATVLPPPQMNGPFSQHQVVEMICGGNVKGADSSPVVYPPFSANQQKRHVVPFGEFMIPTVFAAPVCVSVEETASALPQQLPPPYIVFGGARYEHFPVARKARHFDDPNSRCQREAEMMKTTLKSMSEQLKLAVSYLHLEPPTFLKASPQVRKGLRHNVDTPIVTSLSEEGAFSQKNIWTVAYTGSAKELHVFIEDLDSDALNAKGCVLYSRRQYGIKKCGEKYVLGLGQKGSALQFAAVAGHLDNVLLLLHCGAEDYTIPRLKDILGADVMQTIQAMRVSSRAKRIARFTCAKVDHGPRTKSPEPLTAQEIVSAIPA